VKKTGRLTNTMQRGIAKRCEAPVWREERKAPNILAT